MRPPLTPPVFREWTMTDGYRIRGRVWTPAKAPARPDIAVLYLHGIQSHGGWFEWSASILASCGVPVVLPDRRGSGLNSESRGDTPALERWNEDVSELAGWALREFSIERLGVAGVSWGGKTAVTLALRKPTLVSKLLLVTPGIFPMVDVGIRGRLAIAASLLSGGRGEHAIPLNDPALFTDSPAGRTFIAQDSLKLERATARFLYQSARFDAQLRRLEAGALAVPTTLALSEYDEIIRNEPTRRWAERIGGPYMNIVLFRGQAHTLEFADVAQSYRRLLEGWITNAGEAGSDVISPAT